MRVVAFNGSPRKDGNTTALIHHVFGELRKEGIKTEFVQLADKQIRGCRACGKCFDRKDRRCAVKDDAANEFIEMILSAGGIILGSPSYFQDVTSEMKALIDRTGYVGLANDKMYRNKVGALVSCFRRTGGMHAIETMSHFFFANEFVIAGRALSVARDRGDVAKDEEGILQAQRLGQRMAWLLKKPQK